MGRSVASWRRSGPGFWAGDTERLPGWRLRFLRDRDCRFQDGSGPRRHKLICAPDPAVRADLGPSGDAHFGLPDESDYQRLLLDSGRATAEVDLVRKWFCGFGRAEKPPTTLEKAYSDLPHLFREEPIDTFRCCFRQDPLHEEDPTTWIRIRLPERQGLADPLNHHRALTTLPRADQASS